MFWVLIFKKDEELIKKLHPRVRFYSARTAKQSTFYPSENAFLNLKNSIMAEGLNPFDVMAWGKSSR